jgi:hypothetical protein
MSRGYTATDTASRQHDSLCQLPDRWRLRILEVGSGAVLVSSNEGTVHMRRIITAAAFAALTAIASYAAGATYWP